MSSSLQFPSEPIYRREGNFAVFNQLGVKVDLHSVPDEDYFAWLDRTTARIGDLVPGAKIVEKPNGKPDSRTTPTLNTAVYYDTADYQVLRTGALIRTSCNIVTHAFSACKLASNDQSVRKDHRFVFEGDEKLTIQRAPTSPEAIAIVRRLFARKDIEQPANYLQAHYGINPEELFPSIVLERYICSFFAWLDGKDALRCPMDRCYVQNLRVPEAERRREHFKEVEFVIYPHVHPDIEGDPRVVDLIRTLTRLSSDELGGRVIKEIKYQRGARALGFFPR
jgi:hypothetical protein